MYSLTCLKLQVMSTVEKFILEKFILANVFVIMIRSTPPPQYSILLCLWQQQGQLGKAAFNMVLVKACQIISFPTKGSLPQHTSRSKRTSFGGHWINENLSEVINVWAGSTPTSVGASHSRGSSVQWQWYLQELCTLPGKFHRTGQCLVLQTFLGNSGGCFPDELTMHTPYKGLIGHQSRLCLCMCHSHAHKHNSPPCALPQNRRQLCAPQSPSNCFPKADAVKV